MQNFFALFALVAVLLPFPAQADPRTDPVHIEYLRMVPDLVTANGHEDVIEIVFDKFEIWSHLATALAPLDVRLQLDLTEGETYLNRALTYAVEMNARDCATNRGHADKITYWINFATKHDMLLHLGGEYQLSSYMMRAESCVKVELQLDSVMAVYGHGANAHMVVRAKIPLTTVHTEKGITLTGTAVLEYVSAEMPTGKECTVRTQPVSGTITVTAAEFEWTNVDYFKRALEIKSLTATLTQLKEVESIVCKNSSGNMTLNAWSDLWHSFHYTEVQPDNFTFVLTGWTAGTGQTFASRQYKQNRHSAMFEETTINLVSGH